MEMAETLTVILSLDGNVQQATQVCAISSVVMESLIHQNNEMIQVLFQEMGETVTDKLNQTGNEMELPALEISFVVMESLTQQNNVMMVI